MTFDDQAEMGINIEKVRLSCYLNIVKTKTGMECSAGIFEINIWNTQRRGVGSWPF